MSSADENPPQTKVLVAGATGRTGGLVFRALHGDPKFAPVGLVRSKEKANKLSKDIGCSDDQFIVVSDIGTVHERADSEEFQGFNAMVICTSAVPEIVKSALAVEVLKMPVNLITGKKAFDHHNLKFTYPPGQEPEKVDYEGQKALIDLSTKVGIKHVVVVGSLGGTQPDHFLNSMGKNEDGSGGDILVWKRKAEKYLIESGLNYTIIHPAHLTDTAPGEKRFLLDVDDNLMSREGKAISRGDVASLCVAALKVGTDKNVAFDVITVDAEEGEEKKSAEAALEEFLAEGKTCDYSK